jgi:uncharacterized protein (TIGR02246 family)
MARVICNTLLIVLTLSACQRKADTRPVEAIQAIFSIEAQTRAAYQTRDAAKLASLYKNDATLYFPGEHPRVGAKAIQMGTQKDIADPAFHLVSKTEKVGAFISADSGYSKGSFTVHYTDPKTKTVTAYSGSYLTLFSKQPDGHWKIFEDMKTPSN